MHDIVKMTDSGGLTDTPEFKVPPDHVFAMGDHRDNSSDSRYWGLVPEKYIYGKAFFRYWKPSNMGFLEHGAYDIHEAQKLNDLRAE